MIMVAAKSGYSLQQHDEQSSHQGMSCPHGMKPSAAGLQCTSSGIARILVKRVLMLNGQFPGHRGWVREQDMPPPAGGGSYWIF